MITAPGAAMLDQKLFVSRLDDPFPDLYERLWDGTEWIWVNHGRPQGVRMRGAPGAAMLNEKLFVVGDDGALWERHWRADLGVWVWSNHGRPGNRNITFGPGAAMLNQKLFVVTDDGDLWERHWRADLAAWVWSNHGRPASRRIVTEPGAAMLNSSLFIVAEDGNLWQRHWRDDLGSWVWNDHGRPASKRIVTAPGAAMNNEKLFVVTEDGNLWERHWRGSPQGWAWEDHGRPGGVKLSTAPGAAMMNQKLFVGGSDGHLYERQWRSDLNRWAWQDHGRPPGTDVATPPGSEMLNSKLFVGGANSHLFELVWTGAAWQWVDHGTAFHDQSQHVIGAPGREPKMTVAVMGDGFAEQDMNDYRQLVQDRVVAAFGLDQLGAHQSRVRLIRIDVVSPVSGVTTRDYDEKGNVDPADDTLTSENFRFSRLGFISTGIWSHCWLETSPRTTPRITSIRQRFAPDATNIIVLVNDGRPGGCNSGDVAAFTRGESAQVIAHELGHNLFRLGDEYNNDTRDFTGNTTAVANLTEEPAAWTQLKWAALVAAGAPLPTDPNALPGGWNNNTSVGAFEGGGARFSKGIFRPALDCRMNQNNPAWCPVCGQEIDRIMGAF
jgi:hypothetical protein